jgi:hypothetical protein
MAATERTSLYATRAKKAKAKSLMARRFRLHEATEILPGSDIDRFFSSPAAWRYGVPPSLMGLPRCGAEACWLPLPCDCAALSCAAVGSGPVPPSFALRP